MQKTDNTMSWYCIPLSPEQLEFGFDGIIRAEMEEIWLSQGAPEGVNTWYLDTAENRTIFFSPKAAALAQLLIFRFNGEACSDPDIAQLTFMMGHVFHDE